jgi:hypothetical protein
MADLSQYAVYFGGAGEGSAVVTGTVALESEWVHVNGTLTVAQGYAYGQVDEHGVLIDPGSPGFVAPAMAGAQLFVQLPNPVYGATIFYTDDPSRDNAMTEIDPDTYHGVEADANYEGVGKFLFSQLRSLYESGDYELGANGVRRSHTYTTFPVWVWDDSDPDPYLHQWVQSTNEVTMPPSDFSMVVISRGAYTYMGLQVLPAPGMVIDFDIRWWNGPGFFCDDALRIMTVD